MYGFCNSLVLKMEEIGEEHNIHALGMEVQVNLIIDLLDPMGHGLKAIKICKCED